ncbi:hypothetical protein [Roseospira goensis]|uniref:Uncharacterized protein n=1 Tax=Roseospira goensis TaxID=391922 RepID=A0A7W6RWJ6_9PROT|nr:hypothetical protein [Roseospira goensis]MBB4284396.1 hypothetical protein [Roseospira goensis]
MILPDVPPGAFDAPERRLPQYGARAADEALLAALRVVLAGPDAAAAEAAGRLPALAAASGFPTVCDRVVLVLYQPGERRLLGVRRGADLGDALARVATALRGHARRPRFAVDDPARCRLQMDIVVDPPRPCDARAIGMTRTGDAHFEIGLDGLILSRPGQRRYVLPGDAYVSSYMSMQPMRQRIARLYGDDVFDTHTAERFTSESYVSYGTTWLRLYRGHPVNGALTVERMQRATRLAIDHVVRHLGGDGRFLYYYDAATDSRRDHEHPTRDPDTNPYYNIVRHSGGLLLLLYHARLTGDLSVLEPLHRAVAFLVAQTRAYTTSRGEEALYVYYNRKAKLGGSGVALYALGEYRRLTGDPRYDDVARKIARHLVEQIADSGEFVYYKYYLDQHVTAAENHAYFSFYYPGEALCGLAGYCLHILGDGPDDADERACILDAAHRAMRFLIVERPGTRAEHYRSLPSDAWLMMAVMEFWDDPAFRQDLYKDFVFSDADAMVRQLYTVRDAPYPDYAGAFFYEFGEFPYADGARAEGLMGAFTLAHKVGDRARVTLYGNALRLVAWATMHLVNTPESVYFARAPDIAIGGIRFKYTRQWFRIDTIQHVAAFYLKMMLDGRCPVPTEADLGPAAATEAAPAVPSPAPAD